MGLLSMVLGLPLAPVQGVIKLGELVQRQVDDETHNPASIRAELEEIDRLRERGELSPAEETQAQQQVLDRMSQQKKDR